MEKLNLGCGDDIKKGYVNLDKAKLAGVDIVWDLEKFPYPFKNNKFDEVYCKDVLEHLQDFINVLKEIHRILKKDGKAIIEVPHFTSVDSYGDPTHKHIFSSQYFNPFAKGDKRQYYFNFHFSEIKTRIIFRKNALFFLGYVIEPLFNISRGAQLFYECTFLRCLFPAFNILVTLKK